MDKTNIESIEYSEGHRGRRFILGLEEEKREWTEKSGRPQIVLLFFALSITITLFSPWPFVFSVFVLYPAYLQNGKCPSTSI